MNMKHRRFSLDSSESLEKGSGSNLPGQKRPSRLNGERRKSHNPQVVQLDVQEMKRTNSLRSQIIEEETVHYPDGGITRNSFIKHDKTFHKLFQEIPAEEKLIHAFTCSLQKELLYHGKLYVSDNYVCFYSSVLLKDTKVVIGASTIEEVKKQNAALSMLSIRTTDRSKYSFVSLRSRQVCYNTLLSVCTQAQQQVRHRESGNSSPQVSSAENSPDAVGQDIDTTSSQSSVEDTMEWSSPIELAGRDDSWVGNITGRVKWLVRVMRKSNILLSIYLFLLAVLLLSSGYIGLRIIALEEQLSSLGALTEFSIHHRE
ncbi:GRAM domain-containing protein 2A isoform X1 [Esox lucius]|uniref:GRAM domain-containing protein n=1 Tax=Esox lucius TaxID=8010 RepID=A0A3P8XT13_ESOLU|nr:GRAM domain-containing protein 2A isoform X1 [Esox lucius]